MPAEESWPLKFAFGRRRLAEEGCWNALRLLAAERSVRGPTLRRHHVGPSCFALTRFAGLYYGKSRSRMPSEASWPPKSAFGRRRLAEEGCWNALRLLAAERSVRGPT